jgi:pyruvate/2-oxoglutarate dehydrogenase complex dihydrolipoamide dehydrogenase (E3) component
VELRLGVEASTDAVLALNPEAVVVATGGRPRELDAVVLDGGQLVDAWEVLAGRVETGARVLVFDETGRRQGLGVADLLASAGKSVHVVTPLIYPGMDIDPIGFQRTYQRLAERGVVFTPLSTVTRMVGRRVTLRHVYSGLEQTVDDVDTVVASMLPAAQDALYRALEGKVGRLHLAGDAFAPRFGEDATFEGHRTGLAV